MVAKRSQHVAPDNVAICCVGLLRSFGRGLDKSIIMENTEISLPFWGGTAVQCLIQNDFIITSRVMILKKVVKTRVCL